MYSLSPTLPKPHRASRGKRGVPLRRIIDLLVLHLTNGASREILLPCARAIGERRRSRHGSSCGSRFSPFGARARRWSKSVELLDTHEATARPLRGSLRKLHALRLFSSEGAARLEQVGSSRRSRKSKFRVGFAASARISCACHLPCGRCVRCRNWFARSLGSACQRARRHSTFRAGGSHRSDPRSEPTSAMTRRSDGGSKWSTQ